MFSKHHMDHKQARHQCLPRVAYPMILAEPFPNWYVSIKIVMPDTLLLHLLVIFCSQSTILTILSLVSIHGVL